MWHCSYCPHTSSRKFNIYRHEKRKHSTQTEKLNIGNKNNQMNNLMETQGKPKHSTQTQLKNIILESLKNCQLNEVKVEDNPLLDVKTPAQEVPIQQNEVEKEINYIRYKRQLNKDSNLRMIKRMENRKIIRNCSKQLSKIIKELEKIEAPRKRVIDWLSD